MCERWTCGAVSGDNAGPVAKGRIASGHLVGLIAIAAIASPARQAAAMTLWSSFVGQTYAVLAWIGPDILQDHVIAGHFRRHAL